MHLPGTGSHVTAAGGEIFGVSLEGVEVEGIRRVLQLNFLWVADLEQKLAAAFGVQRLGTDRRSPKWVTFVIDRQGVVRNVIAPEFNIDKHVDEAVAALRSMPRA